MDELKRATDALLLGRVRWNSRTLEFVDDHPRYHDAAKVAGLAEYDEGYYRHILCQLVNEGALTRERFEHLARPYHWISGTMEELRERVDQLFDGPESVRAAVKESLLDHIRHCGVELSSPAFYRHVLGQLRSLGVLASVDATTAFDNDVIERLSSMRKSSRIRCYR